MFPSHLIDLATDVLTKAKAKSWTLATAESCTGGLVAAILTEIPGSSAAVERGFVTYANQAKTDMLGVSPATLAEHGAVSEQTAAEMAAGILAHSPVHLGVSITGIAGPGGGSADKPVGTVCFGLAVRGGPTATVRHLFDGDRAVIRLQAAEVALALLLSSLDA
ncbi:MAG: nicotinamide-nucleotide amidohydrolase family protein [Proteobacteria bacterium]|nr:nicotinamide-nucleotide amidohydrolase family protein [Pseudomonadota bacterium]